MYRGTPLPLPVGEAWSRPRPGSGPALCLECGEVKQSKDFNRAPFENFVARSFLDALALSGAWQFARHRKYTLPHWGISICDACMCASRVQAEDRALSFAMGAHGRLGAISAVQCLAGEPGLLSLIAKPVNKSRDPVDPCEKCPSPSFPDGYIAWRLLESLLRGKLPAVIPTMCRFWEKDGYCKNGDRCKFAHHPLEIEAMRFRVKSAVETPRARTLATVMHAVIAWMHDKERDTYLDDDDGRQAGRRDRKWPGRDTTQERQQQPAGSKTVPPGASRQTCVFWQNVGSCKWGRACKFEHAGADRRNSEGWAPRIGPSTTPWQEWCEDYLEQKSGDMNDRFLRSIGVDPDKFRQTNKHLFEEEDTHRENRRVREDEAKREAEAMRRRRVREDEARLEVEAMRYRQNMSTPDAFCRGVCSHCQIQKQFGATGKDVCSYNGSNWKSCCKCARDRHGWVGYAQNACRNCLARLDGAEFVITTPPLHARAGTPEQEVLPVCAGRSIQSSCLGAKDRDEEQSSAAEDGGTPQEERLTPRAQRTPARWPAGTRVRVHGLQKKPEFNNLTGTVKQEVGGGRWCVVLDDTGAFCGAGTRSGKELSVKGESLSALECDVGDCTPSKPLATSAACSISRGKEPCADRVHNVARPPGFGLIKASGPVPWVRLDQGVRGAPHGGFAFSAPSSSSLPAFGDAFATLRHEGEFVEHVVRFRTGEHVCLTGGYRAESACRLTNALCPYSPHAASGIGAQGAVAMDELLANGFAFSGNGVPSDKNYTPRRRGRVLRHHTTSRARCALTQCPCGPLPARHQLSLTRYVRGWQGICVCGGNAASAIYT